MTISRRSSISNFEREYGKRIEAQFLPYVLLSSAVIIDAAESLNKSIVQAWIENRMNTPLSFEIAWHWLNYGLKHTNIHLRRTQVEQLLILAEPKQAEKIFKWIEREIRRVI